jgi:hypothetical protein
VFIVAKLIVGMLLKPSHYEEVVYGFVRTYISPNKKFRKFRQPAEYFLWLKPVLTKEKVVLAA